MQPVFDRILQIAIVTDDLEKMVRTYQDVFGIGPWSFYQFPGSNKLAICDTLNYQLELIEPIREDDPMGIWLKEHGPSIHHIAVNQTRGFEETRSWMEAAGGQVYKSITDPQGQKNAHINMRASLGCNIEIYDRPADYAPPTPTRVYPVE